MAYSNDRQMRDTTEGRKPGTKNKNVPRKDLIKKLLKREPIIFTLAIS